MAQLIEKKLPNDSLYPELARHYHLAGDIQRAFKYSILAGQFCLDRQAVAEASPYFELAVELTGKDPALIGERPKALEGLADCYITKDKVRADTIFEECIAQSHDPKDLSRLQRKQAECWLPNALGRGDASKANQLLEKASGCASIDPIEMGEIEVLRGQVARMTGDIEDMRKHFTLAKDMFIRSGRMTRVADLTFLEVLVSIQYAEVALANEKLAELRKINTGIDSNRTDAEVSMCQGTLALSAR